MNILQKLGLGLLGLATYSSIEAQTPNQLKTIESKLQKYEYGQYSLIENEPKITYTDSMSIIDNFYSKNYSSTKGTCEELATHLYDDIKNMENVHIYRAIGEEPGHFYDKWDRSKKPLKLHAFLIASTQENPTIDELKAENPYIIDPSYKYIGRLNESQYEIANLIKEDKKFELSQARIPNGAAVPLGFQGEDVIYYYPTQNADEIIIAGTERIKEIYSIHDEPMVHQTITNENILKMIDSLQNM